MVERGLQTTFTDRLEKMARDCGREAEVRLRDVICQAITNQDPLIPYWLVGYRCSVEVEERRGIDSLLVTKEGIEIPFQIKSSHRGLREHITKRPWITCIVVNKWITDERILRLCVEQAEIKRSKVLQRWRKFQRDRRHSKTS